MAIEIFLHLGDIKGESTDSTHKDWIEVLSYSHGAAAPAASEAQQSRSSGPGEIVITKPIDISSPKLYELCSSGKHIPKVTLDVMRARGEKPESAEMSEVVISKISPGVSAHDKTAGGKSEFPTESVSLNYGTIKWTYTQQK